MLAQHKTQAQRSHIDTGRMEDSTSTIHVYMCALDGMRHATQFHIRSCNKYSFCQFSLFSPFIWLLASFYFTFVLLDERESIERASVRANKRRNEQFQYGCVLCVCVCLCSLKISGAFHFITPSFRTIVYCCGAHIAINSECECEYLCFCSVCRHKIKRKYLFHCH